MILAAIIQLERLGQGSKKLASLGGKGQGRRHRPRPEIVAGGQMEAAGDVACTRLEVEEPGDGARARGRLLLLEGRW